MSDGRDDTQARLAGGVKPSPGLLQKWSHAPYWEPDEGVALAFGLDPARVIKSDIAGYHAPYLKAPDPAPHFARFAHRALAMGHLEHRAHPSDFIDWAKTVGLAFHDDWTSALNPCIPAESKIDVPKGPAVGSMPLFAEASAERAYMERVENWPPDEDQPSIHDDVDWLKAKHGAGRDFAREMRRKHAPEAWRAHGRRKTGGN